MGLTPLLLVPLAFGQQPHQHGVVMLNVAVDQRILFLELTAPLQDVAGFEHWPPRNEVEQAAVDRAAGVLSDPQSVFAIPKAAKCKLKDTDIQLPGDHASHDEDDASHDEESEPETTAGAHEEDAEPGATAHVDLTVLFRFNCKAPQKLEQIRVHLFRLFPDLQSIEANLVTDTEQTFQQLNFAEPTLFFAR